MAVGGGSGTCCSAAAAAAVAALGQSRGTQYHGLLTRVLLLTHKNEIKKWPLKKKKKCRDEEDARENGRG